MSDVSARRPQYVFWRLLVLALSLGLIVAATSLALRFNTRPETVYNLSAVLNGLPFRAGDERSDLPFYNRILFPAIHQIAVRLAPFLSESQWYLLLRIAAFQGAFAGFVLVTFSALTRNVTTIGFAAALLAMSTIASFSFPYEEPTDALDLLVMALGVGAALSRRFILCLALAILFAANRESAAYLGIIWATLTLSPERWLRRILEGGAICMASYAATMLIRYLNTGPSPTKNWTTPLNNIETLIEALTKFSPVSWLVMIVAATALFLCNLNWSVPLVRRFVLLAAIFVGPAVLFGLVNEVRVFLPCFAMLAFAVAASSRSA